MLIAGLQDNPSEAETMGGSGKRQDGGQCLGSEGHGLEWRRGG